MKLMMSILTPVLKLEEYIDMCFQIYDFQIEVYDRNIIR